jgi:hypothetical protein
MKKHKLNIRFLFNISVRKFLKEKKGMNIQNIFHTFVTLL